jgi:hypothetical protein
MDEIFYDNNNHLKNTSPESEPVVDISQLFKNPQSFNFPTQNPTFY